jgi:hypothetical protein
MPERVTDLVRDALAITKIEEAEHWLRTRPHSLP